VDAYDDGVRALLGFGADTVDSFRRAVAADSDFALGRAALAVALYLDEQIPAARPEMERAVADGAAQAASLTARERRHLEALRLFVGGRGNDAIAVMQEVLADFPRDMLLMQRLYYIYFWQGRSAEMLEVTRTVLPALADDGYTWGYHAFALEENHRFDEALPLAERALVRNPRDAWAVHAIAHVHYERGDNRRGIESLPGQIHPCDHLGYFRNHLLWHLALLHLAEGDYERGGRLFESVFGRIPIAIASDLQDSWRSRGASTSSGGPIRGAGPSSGRRRGAGSTCRSCSSTTCTWGWPSPPRATGAARRSSSTGSGSARPSRRTPPSARSWCR
jgi:tetratricopeptide (TPR) repeat protein